MWQLISNLLILMSVITMTDIQHIFEPNCWVVPDYPGAEMGSVYHSYDCPHKGEHRSMTVYPDCVHCSKRAPLVMQERFQGCVLSRWARNGYYDSDFYALVWNDTTQAPETVEYASTRGWTYPNAAKVDATPAVLAKYRTWLIQETYKQMIAEDGKDSKAPAPGRVCRVVKGRKIAKGAIVTVRRIGEPTKYSPSRWAQTVVNALVELDKDGIRTQVWTNVENLEVIEPTKYLTPNEALHRRAVACVDQGYTYMPKRLAAAMARIGR